MDTLNIAFFPHLKRSSPQQLLPLPQQTMSTHSFYAGTKKINAFLYYFPLYLLIFLFLHQLSYAQRHNTTSINDHAKKLSFSLHFNVTHSHALLSFFYALLHHHCPLNVTTKFYTLPQFVAFGPFPLFAFF